MFLSLMISSLNNSLSEQIILARFNKQVIRPDFQGFGQVDQKFNNNPMYVGLRQTLVGTSRERVIPLFLFANFGR